MAKNYLQDFQFISIRILSRKSRIPYHKLRNCIAGRYASLTEQERTSLYNIIRDEVEKATVFLGFTYDGVAVKPKD